MQKEILGAYNALFTACAFLFILGLTILRKSYADGDYKQNKSTFEMCLGLTAYFGAEFILRGWWAYWKSGYLARDAVSWMYDHQLVFYTNCVKILSVVLIIKALTEDSPYGRLWQTCAFVIFCVGVMGYLKK